MNKPSMNDASVGNPNLEQTIMQEVESRVQASVVKQFAVIDAKTDRILELLNKLDQNTSAEFKEIKLLINQVRNESRASQEIQTCPSKSSQTSNSLEQPLVPSHSVHAEPQRITHTDSITSVPLRPTIKYSTPCETTAKASQSTKTTHKGPAFFEQALAAASDSRSSEQHAEPSKSSIPKPNLLQALKRSEHCKVTPDQPESIKPMTESSTVTGQLSTVASAKEARRRDLRETIFDDSDSTLPLDSPVKNPVAYDKTHPQSQATHTFPSIKLSTPHETTANASQPSKMMSKSLTVLVQPSSAASDSQSSKQHSEPKLSESSVSKPNILDSLKRSRDCMVTPSSSQPIKTMPESPAVVKQLLNVASAKEVRHRDLSARMLNGPNLTLPLVDSDLTLPLVDSDATLPLISPVKNPVAYEKTQPKSQASFPDLAAAHPEFLDLSETSSFGQFGQIRSCEIVGNRHDDKNVTRVMEFDPDDDYTPPASPVKRDGNESNKSILKKFCIPANCYDDTFIAESNEERVDSPVALSASVTVSAPVRAPRPVPPPRRSLMNTSVKASASPSLISVASMNRANIPVQDTVIN